jgi:penicillin-binding protein 1C
VRLAPRESLTADLLYSQAVYAAGGELMRLTLADDGIFRLYAPLEQISPTLQEATLLYEDRYFRYHFGVNPIALIRGAFATYISKERAMGASTITMQLARKLYDINSSSIGGKLRQIGYAIWLEARYSKDDILEAYLNLVPYGHNIEGAGAASLVYFNKRAEDLSTLESLTLAVIPQNPSKRAPTIGFAEMKRARDPLMQSWVDRHPEDSNKLTHFELPMVIGSISALPYLAPHFVDGVLQSAEGESEIFTVLNLNLQEIMEESIERFITSNRSWGISNAAVLLVDTRSMELLASVGSADFFDDSIEGQVDGTRAMRSPGSLMKPFIYAKAIEQGKIHPRTILKDAPRRYGLYSPENSDRGFMGPITAQDALNQSRNIPAVELLLEISPSTFLELLRTAGVQDLKDVDYYGAALALGGMEITMEDAARIYASLNNGGVVRPIVKVKEHVIADSIRNPEIIDGESAYIVRDMIRHNPPPAVGGFKVNFPFAVGWKTGTSYGFKDGWTALVFGDYVLVAWVGNFDGVGNSAFMGRYSAAPLAFSILRYIHPQLDIVEDEGIPQDLNVKYVDICEATGELPTDLCPRTVDSLFIPGVSPIKISDIFRQIPIDIATGLRACSYDPDTTRLEVYEFWEADLLELFEQAGVKRRTPPRYMPNCNLDYTSQEGTPPTILYPQRGVSYEAPELAFTATAGLDATEIFWFVDGAFVGKSPNGKPFFWRSISGTHSLQAVDNVGRGTSSVFEAN